MKAGQIVEIYQDPITKRDFDGKARLIKIAGEGGIKWKE